MDIQGVNRIGGPNKRKLTSDEHIMYCLGNDNPEHYEGVYVTVSEHLDNTVKCFFPLSGQNMSGDLREISLKIFQDVKLKMHL